MLVQYNQPHVHVPPVHTADLPESLLMLAVFAFLFGAGMGEGRSQDCHQGTDPLVDCLPVLTLVDLPAGGCVCGGGGGGGGL